MESDVGTASGEMKSRRMCGDLLSPLASVHGSLWIHEQRRGENNALPVCITCSNLVCSGKADMEAKRIINLLVTIPVLNTITGNCDEMIKPLLVNGGRGGEVARCLR